MTGILLASVVSLFVWLLYFAVGVRYSKYHRMLYNGLGIGVKARTDLVVSSFGLLFIIGAVNLVPDDIYLLDMVPALSVIVWLLIFCTGLMFAETCFILCLYQEKMRASA